MRASLAALAVITIALPAGCGAPDSPRATTTSSPGPAMCWARDASHVPDLVHWWPGNEHAEDRAGRAHGTASLDTAYGAGVAGGAFRFHGAGSSVRFARPASIGTSDFSLAFWILTTAERKEGVLGRRPACRNSHMLDIRIDKGMLLVELDDGGISYNLLRAASPVNDGRFHHVVLVRRGIEAVLYIDGVRNASSSTALVTNIVNDDDLIAGRSTCTNHDGTHAFTGFLDEISLWSRALSNDEIAAMHRQCAPPDPFATPRQPAAAEIAR